MSNEKKADISNVNAENNSIAIGSIAIGGNVQGNITIGNTGFSSEEVSSLLKEISSTFQPRPFDGTCPYKGLDVFEEEDAELFFGREKLIEELVSRVKASRTVFITGPSGSGKSSLVRAGLIPALKQGQIKGSERWLYATMKPGRDPFEALGRAVSHLAGTTNAEDEIHTKGIKDPSIFTRWCEILLKDGREKRFVLFIDQFEEVFTQVSKEEERVAFLNLLNYAEDAENGRVILLFSMRSDFVPNCAVYPKLNATLNRQFIQIGAMQADELVSAIAQPALRVGLRIDPDLIAQIINDMKSEPGTLPLMSFALKDLFNKEQAKGGMIALTLSEYLENKGINEALQRHADAALAQLSEHEKKLAQSIFSNLIEIGRGTQDTKRTAPFNELVPADSKANEVQAVVQKLADARLVTTEEGNEEYTITHEKLIDAWPWLKKLINENREAITLQNEIMNDAKEWEENKRDVSYLYSGGRLANIWEQVQKQRLALGKLAQDFVRAGRRRQQRNRTFAILAISAILITAIVTSINFNYQANEAQMLTKIALARQLTSQAQSINMTSNSKQTIATLLAIQSLNLFPKEDAGRFLINNSLTAVNACAKTHGDELLSVTFGTDGKFKVLGNGINYNSLYIWESSTGDTISSTIHDSGVNSLAFSSDGKYIASGNEDGSVRIWECTTDKEIIHTTYDSAINSIAFNYDEKYMVSGSNSGSIQVLEIATGNNISQMQHAGSINSVAFSIDGKYIVSGSDDGTARVWNAITGDEISRMSQDSPVVSVVFLSNEKVISRSIDGRFFEWEVETGRENMSYEKGFKGFKSDDLFFLSSNERGNIPAKLWSVENLINSVCSNLTRNLTRAEWNQYIGDALPFQAVCPNLPIEPDPALTPVETP